MQIKPLFAALLLLPPISLSAQKPAAPPPPLLSHQLHPDRTVTFRFKDPAAAKVELNLEGVAKPIPMHKGAAGIWSYTTPPLAPEIYGYSFLDGGGIAPDAEAVLDEAHVAIGLGHDDDHGLYLAFGKEIVKDEVGLLVVGPAFG